jgi:hypothetical protein
VNDQIEKKIQKQITKQKANCEGLKWFFFKKNPIQIKKKRNKKA